MKRRIFFLIGITGICLALLELSSCKKLKTPEAQTKREEWIASFADSIAYYENQNKLVEVNLERKNAEVENLLENFEYVNNPREVTGYYLLKGWQSKIPFKTTGIYARINNNEKLELIATLAGSTFNRIAVGTPSMEYYSEVVPHDQAFNYRHNSFNTVYFSGGKADTIAEYIARHHSEKINLDFLDSSRKKSFFIPEDEKEMIYQTWNLFSAKSEALSLQKELWLNARKIDTFKRMTEMNISNDNSTKQ